jgi:hypothetical protein
VTVPNDLFLYSGEANLNDILLSDPTVQRSGGGDVTVALTGVSATGGVGTLTSGFTLGLTGNSGTGAIGTLGVQFAVPLTGNAASGATGSLAPAFDVSLTGVGAAAIIGSVAPTLDLTLNGIEITVSLGDLSPVITRPGGGWDRYRRPRPRAYVDEARIAIEARTEKAHQDLLEIQARGKLEEQHDISRQLTLTKMRVGAMSQAQIGDEIRILLNKKILKDNEDVMLLLVLLATTV